MRVLLKDLLDCDPDSAWRALRSPAVMQEVASPLMRLEPLTAEGFPTIWQPGLYPAARRGLGMLPLGTQMIMLSVSTAQRGNVRILRDTGTGETATGGGLRWDHRMAVSPDPAGSGRTLYRDQLIFHAGPATLALWPGLWSFWQWRMRQLKQLAPGWRHDVGVDAPADTDPETVTA
ncbi:hypothetical protein [Cryobacterium tepidiphilum]|uniref:SRPBCC family protein n=1 Tax=Cryobacterium tepidiphilum TaxID=2486026 RepID=A0A3M8LR95_9MICO|nr:hypothetical protein [Cryobacterium tepidiphilum]RNE67422.1 hypothetical protein EEJ31_01255 [Cryobacterium tepidiphilum]